MNNSSTTASQPYAQNSSDQLKDIMTLLTTIAEKMNKQITSPPKKSSETKKKSKLSPKERLEIAIEAVQERNNCKVARAHKISEAAVRKCIKNFQNNDKITSLRTKRRQGSNSKGCKFPEMEQKLLEYIIEQRMKKLSVSKQDIKTKALDLFKNCYPGTLEEFAASNGWFIKFLKRGHLSHRTPTHILQQMKKNVEDEILAFWQKILRLRTSVESIRDMGEQTNTLFVNIDEVPIQLDLSPRKTYHIKGSKMVEVKQTYGGKLMCTAILGILSSGYKLPIYLITKSATPVQIPKEFMPYIVVQNSANGWNNISIFQDWLRRILFNLKFPKNVRLVFILDQAKMHTAKIITSLLDEYKNFMSYFFIPSGCTFLLQPLDVSVNKPLKDRLRKRFLTWFQEIGSTNSNETASGYFRPPQYGILAQWLLEEFQNIPKEILIKSFKVCGLTSKLDHSEDNLINPRIQDHLFIEQKLLNKFSNDEHPYDDREEFWNKFKALKEITYEIEETKYSDKTSDNESAISEIELSERDADPLYELAELPELQHKFKMRIKLDEEEKVPVRIPVLLQQPCSETLIIDDPSSTLRF